MKISTEPYNGLVDMWGDNGSEYVGAFTMESMLKENADCPPVMEALARIQSRESTYEEVATGQETVTLKVYEPPIKLKGPARGPLSVW